MIEGRWPEGYQAAISITMDNMGEAAELYRGTWPAGKTIGLHRAVTHHLPQLLELLDRYGVAATYFVEAWNTGHYPGAIGALRYAGHEVAFHGWQHEPWSTLSPDVERSLFAQSLRGFETLTLTIRGFRPPGGKLTELSPELMREYGLTYCSPAADDAAILDGIAYLPFRWIGIDAYYYSDAFAGLREAKGDQADPMEPELFAQRLEALIESCVESNGYTALLFHPFLTTTPERFEVMRRTVERLSQDNRIWCAPCRDVAHWVLDHPETFPDDPGFDATTWSR
jgi:peptidoglycan/xylan/chitin deacetylase (PgdA/CDA1 family)